MSSVVQQVAESVEFVVAALPDELPADRRFLVSVSGPPASGKTTLAAALEQRLGSDVCGVVQMDGFHFDDAVLEARGHQSRKGAPHTFDVASLTLLVEALRQRPELELAVPRFDRTLELSRNGAAVIGPGHRIIVVEGNYLLADVAPWSGLARLFDLTVSIAVPRSELRDRVLARWVEHGCDPQEAERRWIDNDGPNAAWVDDHTQPAHVTLQPAT